VTRSLDPDKGCGHFPYVTHSTLTSKNQTTIPKAVIEALRLRPSDQLVYEIEPDGRVLLSAKTGSFASVAASLSRKSKNAKARTVEEMDAAVKTAAGKRFKRARP
jgi:antitoxin PrlF